MNKSITRSRAELIVYGLLTAFGAAMLFPSLNLGLGEKGNLGPGLLPFAACLCMLVAGPILAISRLIKKKEPGSSIESNPLGRKERLQAIGILLIFAFWPLLAKFTGYILATLLVSFGLAKVVGFKDWIKPIILSVLLTFFIWLIFGVLFQLDLPSGFSF